MSTPMDVVFLGINDVGFRIYDWLVERDSVRVEALLTTPDQLDLVRTLGPDVLVSVGYDHRVSEEILDVPVMGGINLHPAYLPHNRGKSPNVWSIVENIPAGVTLHFMDSEFDTGEIIARRRVPTSFADTGKDVHRRLERAQYDLFVSTWPDIEDGEVDSEPQPPGGSYHSTDDFRELCEIDPWDEMEVKELLDRLRALTFPPFENAYVEIEGTRYYLDISITPEDEVDDETPSGLLSSYD